jgi:DNA-binding MarR family transcriptional regulator
MNRRQERPLRPAKRHLSELQKTIMQWLYTERRRRQRKGDTVPVSFPAVVEGVNTDKASVVTGLRQLMRKGLVEVNLPRGAWTRYVELTEQGEEHASTLVQAARPKLTQPEPDRRYRQRRDKRNRDRDKYSRRMPRR